MKCANFAGMKQRKTKQGVNAQLQWAPCCIGSTTARGLRKEENQAVRGTEGGG